MMKWLSLLVQPRPHCHSFSLSLAGRGCWYYIKLHAIHNVALDVNSEFESRVSVRPYKSMSTPGIKELISCVVKVTASQDIGGQILYG